MQTLKQEIIDELTEWARELSDIAYYVSTEEEEDGYRKHAQSVNNLIERVCNQL